MLAGLSFIGGLLVGVNHAPLYKSNMPMTSEHDMVYNICDRSYRKLNSALYEQACGDLQDITGIEYQRGE